MSHKQGGSFVGVLGSGSFHDLIVIYEREGKLAVRCPLAGLDDVAVLTKDDAAELANGLWRKAELMRVCAEKIREALHAMHEREELS